MHIITITGVLGGISAIVIVVTVILVPVIVVVIRSSKNRDGKNQRQFFICYNFILKFSTLTIIKFYRPILWQ